MRLDSLKLLPQQMHNISLHGKEENSEKSEVRVIIESKHEPFLFTNYWDSESESDLITVHVISTLSRSEKASVSVCILFANFCLKRTQSGNKQCLSHWLLVIIFARQRTPFIVHFTLKSRFRADCSFCPSKVNAWQKETSYVLPPS